MRQTKWLSLILLFLIVGFISPKTSHAVSLQELFTSDNSVIARIQERFEYMFAIKTEKKIDVLENQAEKRLNSAQNYAEVGDSNKVQSQLGDYLQLKNKQNDLLEKTDEDDSLGGVQERTLEQQRTMEKLKTVVGEETKQEVVQVQEQVVNQVAKNVIDKNGPEGATNFLNEVAHVWAPGTGPGGEAGVVYSGGGKLIYAAGTGPGGQAGVVIEGGEMKFAAGTSAGSPAGSDIKTVEIKTGGGGGSNVVEGGNPGAPPPENQNADPGTNNTRTWIDP